MKKLIIIPFGYFMVETIKSMITTNLSKSKTGLSSVFESIVLCEPTGCVLGFCIVEIAAIF
jgi:hypothetical protein